MKTPGRGTRDEEREDLIFLLPFFIYEGKKNAHDFSLLNAFNR